MKTCLLCSKDFKSCIKINGKLRNLGARKYCLDCSPFGLHNTSDPSKKSQKIGFKICKFCKLDKPFRDFFFSHGRPRYICKDCDLERVNKINLDRKRYVVEKLGGQCKICGYKKYFGALDAHHIDSTLKKISLSNLSCKSLLEIEEELPKCILLCSNCHREVHGGIIN